MGRQVAARPGGTRLPVRLERREGRPTGSQVLTPSTTHPTTPGYYRRPCFLRSPPITPTGAGPYLVRIPDGEPVLPLARSGPTVVRRGEPSVRLPYCTRRAPLGLREHT